MNFFEKNMAVILEHFPGLEKEMRKADGLDARVETAASGAPTFAVNGAYIHSKYDPVKEGRKLAETVVSDGRKGPVVVLGFGLGYAAEAVGAALAERANTDQADAVQSDTGEKSRRPFIIVERHGLVLKKALESRDLSQFFADHTIVFILGGPDDNIVNALDLFDGRDISVIKNRSLMACDADWYEGVERHISTWKAKDKVNEATLKRFGERWRRNFERNKEAVRDVAGITGLRDMLRGEIPALLVAAGPSLDGLLLPAGVFVPPSAPTVLRELADRCLVVAVDTSLRFLLRAGVDPDFTVSSDPQYWNARHLDCAAHGGTDTCLVTEAAVYPMGIRYFKKKLLYASHFPDFRAFEDAVDPKGYLGAGGSVATTAFDLCFGLGASAIFIAGLDLSFPNLKTHFKGALFEEKATAEANRLCPAETRSVRALRDGGVFYAPQFGGGRVLTDSRLSLYAAWFENRLRSVSVPSFCLSEDGLAIAGMKIGSVQDILRLPKRRSKIDGMVSAILTKVDGEFEKRRAERGAKYEKAYLYSSEMALNLA